MLKYVKIKCKLNISAFLKYVNKIIIQVDN